MTLDPRAPLVIDTHDLGRRAGSERTLQLTVPAPGELGVEMLRVPEGSPLELDLRLEAVLEGVLVTGTVLGRLEGECVRCLEAIDDEIEVDLTELYVYDAQEGDEETSTLDGDLLDLEPAVRDAVVLELPLQPLCQDDCEGLCAECGVRLLDEPGHHHDAPVDPRWAALGTLKDDE
jgi:uncharacterized protein